MGPSEPTAPRSPSNPGLPGMPKYNNYSYSYNIYYNRLSGFSFLWLYFIFVITFIIIYQNQKHC